MDEARGGCGKPGHVTGGSDGEGTCWCQTCEEEGRAMREEPEMCKGCGRPLQGGKEEFYILACENAFCVENKYAQQSRESVRETKRRREAQFGKEPANDR